MPVPVDVAVSSRTLLRDTAYERLRDAIVDGTFTPGEQLREVELQRWLGVSRTPIREALMRLQHAGLVRTLPGRSTAVSELDSGRVRDAQPVVASMHELAVRLAVPHLRPRDVEEMRSANQRFARALERQDITAALQADDELHAIPVRVAANSVVRDVLEQFSPLLRRIERQRFSSAAGRDSVGLHDTMIEHCLRGDADEAAATALGTWRSLVPGAATPDETVSAGHGLLRSE